MRNKIHLLLVVVVISAMLLVACGGEKPKSKPTIKLIENAWSASELNVAVAKIILEEQLKYQVEVISLDENAQWAALSAGNADASLEVWPSGHMANVKQYIEQQKMIEHGGALGPVGKIGWYIPSYMLKEHPELATWEGFKDPANAKLFTTPETGDKGQFLGGDASFVQYDADIIKNLGLNFKVVYAGSEQAILAQLDAAYSRKSPILFYLWTPHSIHAKYELSQVKLPPYSEECYAKAASGGIDCDYPPDNLFKIFWPNLKNKAPEAYQLLKNMTYTTKDQITMIAEVELNKKTKEQSAREWLKANESVWKAWLPK